MTIKEIIEELNKVKEKYGNVQCVDFDGRAFTFVMPAYDYEDENNMYCMIG